MDHGLPLEATKILRKKAQMTSQTLSPASSPTTLQAGTPGQTVNAEPQAKKDHIPCESCNDTGDLVRFDGEWMGYCPCINEGT